ncbi:MAG: hypothetical protein FJZ87_04570 [Chloroflexi bacterium]|nr:hypothetical protein [Chloroflexota bacterium]
MSSEERRKILQLVSEGRINAEEAARLMQALAEPSTGRVEVIPPGVGGDSETARQEEFDQVRRRALRLAMIPLWIGILLTVSSSWGMYAIQQNTGYNFWFFFLVLPLFLGILLIVIGSGSTTSRWLYVNVDRTRAQDWPKYITIALPLPLGLVSWFLNNFGTYIEGLKKTTVDEVIQAIALTKSIKEPLIVNVDDGEEGERVLVYIG